MPNPALPCLGQNYYTLDLCINFLSTWEWVVENRLSEFGFPVALRLSYFFSLSSMLQTWDDSKQIALMLTDQIWGGMRL